MDPTLLQQFRQQLAVWIETRLESQRLPFQRLELCPETLTDRGYLAPDLVLWINRDSQLTGSMLLLPDIVDDQALAKGISLANALGLGHFTTWAAREVSIWQVSSRESVLLHALPLPPANRITPEDFQRTLDNLLERLKIITVTSAPPTTEHSVHYFANLCLRNLHELAPGLTISARMSGGETAADEWVEHAPMEKAWMSLWRILFLLWHGRLPPGLQPERLELAIRYALVDLTGGQLSWLDIHDSEPPLPEEVAIRLHHLASRLRQLGWPQNNEHVEGLVCLLLNEAAHDLGLVTPLLPWATEGRKLYVACQPPQSETCCSLIARPAYLAGWAIKAAAGKGFGDGVYKETLQTLDKGPHLSNAIAVLQERRTLRRNERDDRLIFFRQVWPSRRFDLPYNAPTWLWDAIYLAGLISKDLSLILPHGWYRAPGIQSLWTILIERYQLIEISEDESGQQSLHFVESETKPTFIRAHRSGLTIEIPSQLSANQKPGTTQVWLKASQQTVEFLNQQAMTGLAACWPNRLGALSWGLFVFLQTRLGRRLWDLCSGQASLPEFKLTAEAVLAFGVPVPDENRLLDLSLIGSPDTLTIPGPELLEREFLSIFGPAPEISQSSANIITDTPRMRRRNTVPAAQITDKVFLDGIPHFPEHYLMNIYRPTLIHYDLCGPMEIAEEFFDRFFVRTIGQDHTIEVSGKCVAEALILSSYAGEGRVSLPKDERILEELVKNYRTDLRCLRDKLIRECRRFEPNRQAAINLSRKIWRQKGLPPESVFDTE